MKYAVIMYIDSDNIGDDIQTYATLKYLPKIDYIIDRESINEFICDNNVKAILNGWFLYNNTNWPPSNNIDVLPISMHITTSYFKNEYERILFEYRTKKYFNMFSNVGCRDIGTSDYLSKLGINSYTSYCLTLTIDKFDINPPEEKYICAVDLDDDEYQKLKLMTNIKIKRMTHDFRGKNLCLFSFEERMKKVEEYLKIYQNAYCVVTTRYHAAMPSIALETPVILIPSSFESSRYEELDKFVHIISRENFLSNDYYYDFNKLKTNKDISDIKENLENICYSFINNNKVKINNYCSNELENTYLNLLKDYENLFEEFENFKRVSYYKNLDLNKFVESNLK